VLLFSAKIICVKLVDTSGEDGYRGVEIQQVAQ